MQPKKKQPREALKKAPKSDPQADSEELQKKREFMVAYFARKQAQAGLNA